MTKSPGRFSHWVFAHKPHWLALVLVLGIGSDQALKMWTQSSLATWTEQAKHEVRVEDGKRVDTWVPGYRHSSTVTLVPDAFDLIYRENPAAAFSLTRQVPEWLRRPLLLLVSTFAMILISVWYFRMKKPDGLLMSAFALIVAGAVGNFIDRLRFGYVIDMLDAYTTWPPLADKFIAWFGTSHWPTFNIADSCIVGGAIGVIWRTLKPLYPPDEDEAPPPAKDAPPVEASPPA